MVYQYKVTLKGLKGFYRIYNVNSENSLYSFHKQMRSDMEFAQDQLILFKAYDENGGVAARYGLFDLGSGTVDEMTFSQTLKKGITKFTYFYDVTNKKSVEIEFIGEAAGVSNVASPVIVESKGPNPIEFENGYVAFEDLPDDQRHLPSESDKAKKSSNKLEELLGALTAEDDAAGASDEESAAEDEEDLEEEDAETEEADDDEDGMEIFDGSEELTL